MKAMLVISAVVLTAWVSCASAQPKRHTKAHTITYWRHVKAHARYVVRCYDSGRCARGARHAWGQRVYRRNWHALREANRRLARLIDRPALPRHYQQWLCIYSHENGGYGWRANTGNGYFGGLQMDREFMADYGADFVRKYGGTISGSRGYRRAYGGEANHWAPVEQMIVAERAWPSRGFYPWPNTARMCGLL